MAEPGLSGKGDRGDTPLSCEARDTFGKEYGVRKVTFEARRDEKLLATEDGLLGSSTGIDMGLVPAEVECADAGIRLAQIVVSFFGIWCASSRWSGIDFFVPPSRESPPPGFLKNLSRNARHRIRIFRKRDREGRSDSSLGHRPRSECKKMDVIVIETDRFCE